MTRLLRVYSGSDSSPVGDFTDDTDWEETEFSMAANNGESGVGRVVIYDEDGVIPDALGGKFVNSHNVILAEDGPYRLFRGRVGTKEFSRRERRGKRVRVVTVTTGDYNTDLRGIVVEGWQRGQETDRARVQGLIADYLSGSRRPTTVLSGSNYVSGSNLVTLPARTYSGVTPQDILIEIGQAAGKIHFVTIDGEMFYDGTESTAYASGLRISDDPADANATTYEPQWDAGAAANEDGIDQATAMRAYFGANNESVRVTNTLDTSTDYWEVVEWDSVSADAAAATTRAVNHLDELSRDALTYNCTIGPIPWAQLGSIKVGQTIQFKALAARGGRTSGGAFSGDSFLTVRIAELTWKMPAVNTYLATVRLVKPLKIAPRTKTGSEAGNLAANIGLPGGGGTGGSGTCTPTCTETFTRFVTTGLGVSEFCPAWQFSLLTADPLIVKVTDGEARFETASGDTASAYHWVDVMSGGLPVELLWTGLRIKWSTNTDTWDVVLLLDGQPDPAGSSRWAYVGFSPTVNVVNVELSTSSGAGAGPVAFGTFPSKDVTLNVRVRLELNAMRVRVWQTGFTEPPGWILQDLTTDESAIHGQLVSLGLLTQTITNEGGLEQSLVQLREVAIIEGCVNGTTAMTYGAI